MTIYLFVNLAWLKVPGGILVEALWVARAHFHRHALEELEGLTAKVGQFHAA